jgi:hypothetical protein
MKNLSQQTQKLIQRYQSWHKSLEPKEGITTLHVDEVAGKVASFYEKIKGVVDWKEEHLLRKRAIERALKRKTLFLKENYKMAESLVYELIRGGHFPNDTIPETKVKKVQEILNKYFFIFKTAAKKKEGEKVNLQNWLLEIASFELEKTLAPPQKEEALIEYMTDLMKERIKVREGIIVIKGIKEEEKNKQIYIAVQRALLKLDSPTISFYLLEKKYPQWSNLSPLSPLLSEISKNIYLIKEEVEKDLSHPLSEKFYQICEKYNTPYLILGDIIENNSVEAQKNLENPEILENLIKKTYQKRTEILGGRLKRAAIYSTISIFLTKIAIALAVEIPFDKYITGVFDLTALKINILFPPILMFLLVITIRRPNKENLQQLKMEIMKICYERERKDIYEIEVSKKIGRVLNTIILAFYFLAFLISFGAIILVLQKLNFGILSMVIFIFYLSLISFLGIKIRERSKELIIKQEKETFLNTLMDFFLLPIVRLGKWLSEKWAKLDLALIIAVLIDVPFLIFVELLEQWRYFLKKKKEEIH